MKATTALLLSMLLLAGGKKDHFSIKSIENRMVKVEADLYANKYETTNAEYRDFLEWTKANKPEIANEVKIHEENWEYLLSGNYKKWYSTLDKFDEYPVVNISYEAANHFCDWLTTRYHEGKKRKFEKVKFRLPTEKEWLSMALSGLDQEAPYPWGSPFLKNMKGKYLANFFPVSNNIIKIDIKDRSKIELEEDESKGLLIGNGVFVFTAPVNSYHPSRLGLHNLSGNAAEMLSEKGRTKGGSFGSSGYYIRLQAEDEFEGFTTSPYVGFRYVMEVIEK